MSDASERALPRAVVAGAEEASATDIALRRLDETMARYAGGDDAALDELYRCAAPRVRSFLLRLSGNLALAEDLTQEAFLRVCRARGHFVAGSPALPWVLAIARNVFLDQARHERVRRAHHADVLTAQGPGERQSLEGKGDDALVARRTLDVVNRALMSAPVRQREAFVLVRFEGLSLADAAEVMGTTPAAAKLLVFRAYSMIRAALDRDQGDER
jgi:RNA polymerase sigma-70 factor (ECF subfamily)